MLKDITIGQYFPGNSIIHRIDARFKIIITTLFIIMIFSADTAYSLSIGVVFMVIAYLLTKLSPKLMLKSLRPVVPVLAFTAILNIFFFEGKILVKIWFLEITDEGIKNAAFMLIRVVALIIGSSVLTYTTSPISLTHAIEKLMMPLSKLKFPVHELAMMMTIALRFIPTLIEETDKIISAQKARGADFENGNIAQRAKAVVPILVPLFVSAFRRAEDLALAMECRCYQGGQGRTRMRQSEISIYDFTSLIVSLIFLTAVFLIDHII